MRTTTVFRRIALIGLASIILMIVSGSRSLRSVLAPPAEAAETQGSLQAFNMEGKSQGFCPLVHTDVRGEISGVLSRVTVTQKFQNSFAGPIAAVYTFPLPHNAAVDDMTIRVGARTIRGVIKRREDARALYEQARAQGKTAGLLDQERPNIFSQKVANILPGQNVEVTIGYFETLKYENGGYTFVFPIVVGPRYISGEPVGREGGGWSPDTDQVPDASRITPGVAPRGTRAGHDISIEVSIESGVPLSNLRSAQHDIVVLQRDSHSALVRLAHKAVIPNKDFILSYDVAGSILQDGFVMHRDGADGYFMLILQPPRRVAAEKVLPKELVFVLDTSGSLKGFPIEKAKETMRLALGELYPRDTFNLITFSNDMHVLFPQAVPATPANLAAAQECLESHSGEGGTEMLQAIRAALEPSDSQDHLRIVCFMTDGFVGNDMQIISEVQKHPNARVFAFGIGTSVNRFLLERLAEEGRGAVEYVTPASDAASATRRFHERIRNPLLTDISLEWGGLPVADVYPRRIPDVFSAEPVVVCGRYSRGGYGFVRLRSRAAGEEITRELEIQLPEREARYGVLAKFHARKRIDELMSQDDSGIQSGTPRLEVRDAIAQLGLQHGLMTQFTSFVAIEERVVTDGGKVQRVEVPVEMPEGVSHDGVFGVAGLMPVAGVSGVVGGVPGGLVGGIVGGVLGGVPPPPPPPPSPLAASRAPMRVGGQLQESKLIRKVEPDYPELARQARLSAAVILQVTVNEQGNVADARVLRGHPLLDEAAVRAVKQWKYSQTLLNGSPVRVVATAVLAFNSSRSARLDPAVALAMAR